LSFYPRKGRVAMAAGEEPCVGLREFDISSLKTDRVVLILGKRGTGKTVLLKDICYHLHKSLDLGVAMAPTQESVDMFRSFMPPMSVYNDFRADRLEALIEAQRRAQKENKYRNVWVILDDCMFDKKALKSKAMRDIFMNGRHYNFLFINLMQYVMDMGPDLRSQVDYVFTMRETVISNREKLYKFFFGIFPTYGDFSNAMDVCTENYSAMVLDNTRQSTRPEDCVFWYRANPKIPRFLMGNRNWWKLSHAFYVGESGFAAGAGASTSIPTLVTETPAAEEDDAVEEEEEEPAPPPPPIINGKKRPPIRYAALRKTDDRKAQRAPTVQL
jgi:hypothetical protein